MILLAAYPKSGNTWMRALLGQYFAPETSLDINKLAGFQKLTSRVAFDETMGVTSADLTAERVYNLRRLFAQEYLRQNPDRRFIKVHEAWDPNVFVADGISGVVYVVRDPRNVVLSYADHQGWTVERLVEFMTDPAAGLHQGNAFSYEQLPQHLGTWGQHYQMWATQDKLPMAVVKYEDMVADTASVLARAVTLFGKAPDRARISGAVRDCAFALMAKQEAAHGFSERNLRTKRFFNRGATRNWRQDLNPTFARRIEDAFEPQMTELGYL